MKRPSLNDPSLSTVYLDNKRVGLMGDPAPAVAKIVAATGREPAGVEVMRATSARDSGTIRLDLSDVVDRTLEPSTPIYLTTKSQPQPDPESARYLSWPLRATRALRGPTAIEPAAPAAQPPVRERPDGIEGPGRDVGVPPGS